MKKSFLTTLLVLLSLTAAGQELQRVPGIYGFVYDVDGNPVGSGTPVNLTVKVCDHSTGALIYNESRNTITGVGALSNFYYFTEDNAPYGVEGENNTFGVACYLGYRIGVNISKYGQGGWPESSFQADIHLGYASNLTLDVGNDTRSPWEWESAPGAFTNREEQADLNPDKINMILRNNCQCSGCILNETTSECIIPLVFSSDTPGKITVDDIYIEYESLRVIECVDYNKSFRVSEGADWTIDVSLPALYTTPIPQDYAGGDTQRYTPAGAGCGRTVGIERDAVDDAMWRLLDKIDVKDRGDGGTSIGNCQLNEIQLPDGGFTPFDPATMFFRIRRYSVTPELWGPALVKLIVWI
ncbi:MAG: hypothetical protein U9M95_02570 [Candidatus Altiarchaeota archaeon]|nr:hypothetical protein [Candidatus Altiarchaeota archaeon]